MAYPDDIDEFREIENLPGLSYDPEDKKTFFVEDLQAVRDSITAIENFIGTDSAGADSPLFQLFANIFYPVGRIVAFATDYDPNDVFDWQTWEVHGPGRVLVTQDEGTFDTLGEDVGSEDHNHGLSEDGYAKVWVSDSTGRVFHKEKVSVPNWANTTATAPSTPFTSSTSIPNAAELGGDTDDGSSIQPSKVGVRWVRTA